VDAEAHYKVKEPPDTPGGTVSPQICLCRGDACWASLSHCSSQDPSSGGKSPMHAVSTQQQSRGRIPRPAACGRATAGQTQSPGPTARPRVSAAGSKGHPTSWRGAEHHAYAGCSGTRGTGRYKQQGETGGSSSG
jgi:hypothetical protein